MKGGEHQIGPQVVSHGPAYDPAAEAIQDDRQVEPALAGRNVRDIGQPEPVGPADGGRREGTPHPVRSRGGARVGDRRAHPAALATHAAQPGPAHEPRHPPSPDRLAALAQSGPHPGTAIRLATVCMDLANLLRQQPVGAHPRRGRSGPPGEIARARHAQHAAELPHRVLNGLGGDEPVRVHRGALVRAK